MSRPARSTARIGRDHSIDERLDVASVVLVVLIHVGPELDLGVGLGAEQDFNELGDIGRVDAAVTGQVADASGRAPDSGGCDSGRPF